MASPEPPPAQIQAKAAEILDFPDELLVADESVNAFVRTAMGVCSSGDYDAFRLLWSVRYDPLSRDEFEQGWQAVEAIQVQALEQAILQGNETSGGGDSAGETVYIVAAEVIFDPTHPAGRREPQRQVVLMLTKEQGRWRLARAPKPLRTWIRERIKAAKATSSGPETARQSEIRQPVSDG